MKLATPSLFIVFVCAGILWAGANPPPRPRAELSFNDATEAQSWQIIGDRVMLGRSDGGFTVADGAGTFAGTLRRSIGGAWCSARRELDKPVDLSGDVTFRLRVRGDGKEYGFDVRDSLEIDGVYWEARLIPAAGEWQTMELHPYDFKPLDRGKPAKSATPLRWEDIRSFAFVVAKNQLGAFKLEIDSIEVVDNDSKSEPAVGS